MPRMSQERVITMNSVRECMRTEASIRPIRDSSRSAIIVERCIIRKKSLGNINQCSLCTNGSSVVCGPDYRPAACVQAAKPHMEDCAVTPTRYMFSALLTQSTILPTTTLAPYIYTLNTDSFDINLTNLWQQPMSHDRTKTQTVPVKNMPK